LKKKCKIGFLSLAALKTAGFRWAKIGGKKLAKNKSEDSSVAVGASHYWLHIFSNDIGKK